MKTSPNNYTKEYYHGNKQSDDRIALRFYYRLATSYIKSGKVLDFGSGTGHFIKRFGRGFEAWAYDISPHARQSVKRVSPFATICSSFDELRGERFNLIAAIHVLEHLEEPLKTLQFFSDILEINGVLLYVVPNTSGLGHRLKKQQWFGYGDPTHISLYPASIWTRWTESAGFAIFKSGTDGLWNVPYLSHIPLWLQKLIFYPLPALQVLTGRLILPVAWGESLIVVAKKQGTLGA